MKRITRWQDIRPGAFWCVHGTSWISWAIRWVTGQDWNHCGWVVELRNGEPWTQEALNTIEVNPLSNYRKEFDRGALAVFQPDIPPPVLDVMVRSARLRVGTRYGWLSTLSLAWWLPLNRIAGWFGLQVTTPHRRYKKCSEEDLVAAVEGAIVADTMRLDVPDLEWAIYVPDREMFTPGDLYDRLTALVSPAPAQAVTP